MPRFQVRYMKAVSNASGKDAFVLKTSMSSVNNEHN